MTTPDIIEALTDDEMHAVREAIIYRRDELAAAGLAGETPEPDFIDLDNAAQKFGLAPYPRTGVRP